VGARALGRALEVLGLVATGELTGARDLALRLGLPRSTAHRMLAELLALRLVQRDGRRLLIGPRIAELAGGAVGYQRLVQVARPAMIRLRDRVRETVALHALQGGRRVLLHQAESVHEHRWVYTNPGQPMPLHAGAASKMLLAMLPEAEAAALVGRTGLAAFTPDTPRDPARLGRDLARIRRDRCATSLGEVTPGIASIAVPVETGDSAVRAALSVTGPMLRLTAAVLEDVRPLLRATAVRIGRQLRPARRRTTGRTA
jgi:IclR family acetate operon transcriptional repressor